MGIAGDTGSRDSGSGGDSDNNISNNNSSTSSSTSTSTSTSTSDSVLPELRCGPANRRNPRLFGPPRPIRPPPGCQRLGPGRGAVLCDLPGEDYPW